MNTKLIKLAQRADKLKAAKNKAAREETAALKELQKEMEAAGIEKFDCPGDRSGTLDVFINRPTSFTIDVKKLKSIVSDSEFMKIVSATKKAVTDAVGSRIAADCSKEKKGSPKVYVESR